MRNAYETAFDLKRAGMEQLYYFAHKYTCIEDVSDAIKMRIQQLNYELCLYRTTKLTEAGYYVFSPIVHTHPIQMTSQRLLTHKEQRILAFNLDLVIIANACFFGIILAPGWEDSDGCKLEKKYFEEQGKIVLYYADIVRSIE